MGRNVDPAQEERAKALDGLEISRALTATTIGLEFVRNALVAGEAAHTGSFDGADVNECVISAAIGRDEAETLGFIEEFDSTLHIGILPGDADRQSTRLG